MATTPQTAWPPETEAEPRYTHDELGAWFSMVMIDVAEIAEIAAGLLVGLDPDDNRRQALLDLMLGGRLFVGGIGALPEEWRGPLDEEVTP